jgi:predicted transcriptional regulator
MLELAMTATLDTLSDQLKGLPEDKRQQWLARFSLELSQAETVYQLSPEERELVREGLADLDAGCVVPEAEMEAFWNRNRRA